MTIKLSLKVGSGSLQELVPDLTIPSQLVGVGTASRRTSAIDTTTGGLVTVLSLTGKHAVGKIELDSMPTSESVTVKLTIGGVIIYNDTFINTLTSLLLVGGGAASEATYLSKTSLLLEVTTVTGTVVTSEYIARKIK